MKFVPDAKPQTSETSVRILGARVLTSDKCVAIVKERKEKWKQQEGWKKVEREQRKRATDKEQKRKKALAAEKKALATEKRH